MATLSPPDWQPTPVTSLPQMTTVSYTVKPRGKKVKLEYELITEGNELKFQAFGQASELPLSTPKPTPSNRSIRKVVDVIDNLTGPTPIVRALEVGKPGAEKPGLVSSRVTVSDFDDGVPKNTRSDSAMIAFNLT